MSNQVVRCENQRCKVEFGPVVGSNVVISVGAATYIFDGVFAIQCECGTVKGQPLPFVGEAQDNRCPGCNAKAGELYPTGVVASSRGRTVWAQRVTRVQCRCGCDWEPRYAPQTFVTINPKKAGAAAVAGAMAKFGADTPSGKMMMAP